MKKEKFKRVRVLCSEDSLRDVLAALLSGNFKSEVPAAKTRQRLISGASRATTLMKNP